MLEVREVGYAGWARNLRLANAEVELIVTLEVGPRIIRYAPVGGANVLKEVPAQLGRSGEDTWQMRGGHRLWVSPEDPLRTYVPDNVAVERTDDGEVACVRVSSRADARFGLERCMEIRLAPEGSEATIVHRVRNLAAEPCTLAPWALTVMAEGGVAVVPLPSGRAHPGDAAASAADFAPSLTMALWPYFRFDDERVALGRRYLRLRHDLAAVAPTKLGFAHRSGWASYWRPTASNSDSGTLFVKRFDYQEGATYPDGGCNFETYTDANILELETLGPLVRLDSGGETSHIERWSLHAQVPAPSNETIIDETIAAVVAEISGLQRGRR